MKAIFRPLSRPFFRPLRKVCHLLIPPACLCCERKLGAQMVCTRCTPSRFEPDIPRCFSCFSISELSPCAICQAFPLLCHRLRFLWHYEGIAQDLIGSYKYRPCKPLAKYFGNLLLKHLSELFDDRQWDLVVPIASSNNSIRSRGFSSTLEILKKTALNLPLQSLLKISGQQKPQASLAGNDRLNNVKNKFYLDESDLKGAAILLFDDVVTSGATVTAATKCLLDAGAGSVDVLALARSLHFDEYRAALHHWTKYNGSDKTIRPCKTKLSQNSNAY